MTPVQQTSMRPCPHCGAEIPKNIKGCWSCGEILDPHIIELAEKAEAAR